MSRKQEPEHDWLREKLRAWDPVRSGQELDRMERARMRRRLLAAASEPVRPPISVRVLATAAVVLLTAVLGWGLYENGAVRPPGTARSRARPAPSGDPAAEPVRKARQIQFSTPGGTRVVWTLDPDFKV